MRNNISKTALFKKGFSLWILQASLTSKVKRMTMTARGKHLNPRADLGNVKQNNPNNPSDTEVLENKDKTPGSTVTTEMGLLFKQTDKQL